MTNVYDGPNIKDGKPLTVDGNQLAAFAGMGGTGSKEGVFAKIEKLRLDRHCLCQHESQRGVRYH